MYLDNLYKIILNLCYMELLNNINLQQQKVSLQNSVHGTPGFLLCN